MSRQCDYITEKDGNNRKDGNFCHPFLFSFVGMDAAKIMCFGGISKFFCQNFSNYSSLSALRSIFSIFSSALWAALWITRMS